MLARRLFASALLLFCAPALAGVDCSPYGREPGIRVEIKNPEPRIQSIMAESMQKLPLDNPRHTLGLTVADFVIGFEFRLESTEVDGGFCTAISDIGFGMGYSGIEVFIDDRVRPGTECHAAVMEHEMEHVGIFRRVLEKYGPLIRKELEIIAMNLDPVFLEKTSERAIDGMVSNQVYESERIRVLTGKMEREKMDLNAAHDSSDEYARIGRICR
ncbi:MAG: hypothetical protein LBT92_00145 [Rickettsiales bacterium]|jgi:hypothetical protein|nr:hypothetical protein [Rickettsiales bacterium]